MTFDPGHPIERLRRTARAARVSAKTTASRPSGAPRATSSAAAPRLQLELRVLATRPHPTTRAPSGIRSMIRHMVGEDSLALLGPTAAMAAMLLAALLV